MTSVVPLSLRGTVSSRAAATELLTKPGDAALVERGRPRLLVLSCPCGCGENFPINLDPRAGPAWRMYHGHRSSRSTLPIGGGASRAVSVFPSVWRDDGCRSHYVIWNDRILLFDSYGDDFEDQTSPSDVTADQVFAALREDMLQNFADIAESLEAVPWDVLRSCRALVRLGRAREGIGQASGSFAKTPQR